MLRSRFSKALAIAGREAVALAKQAWLLPRDLTTPVVPEAAADGDDVVVLIHGLFATAGVLRPLADALGRHVGVHTAALSYAPGTSFAQISDRIGALLEQVPAGVRVHLVGHSLGGVVGRHYAVVAGDPRVVQTISVASPFGGVTGAATLGLARDLDPASPLLRELRLADLAASVPHVSIVSTDDAVVRAPVSHALPHGEVVVLHGIGHNALLFAPEVHRHVVRRVLRRRGQLHG